MVKLFVTLRRTCSDPVQFVTRRRDRAGVAKGHPQWSAGRRCGSLPVMTHDPLLPDDDEPMTARRLTRSTSDKLLGGVAGGLGEYFGVDSLLFRIAFGVSIFFGGLGALVYIALLVFLP